MMIVPKRPIATSAGTDIGVGLSSIFTICVRTYVSTQWYTKVRRRSVCGARHRKD